MFGQSGLFRLVLHLTLISGKALSWTTLRVVGITTRSVVQLSLPTQVLRLDNALAPFCERGDNASKSAGGIAKAAHRIGVIMLTNANRIWTSRRIVRPWRSYESLRGCNCGYS